MEDPLTDISLEYIEDPDAVFPDVHARPLVVSSQLLLISSAAAFYVAAKRGVMVRIISASRAPYSSLILITAVPPGIRSSLNRRVLAAK